jgi:hypothetical protein
MRVSELIDQVTGQWDEELIRFVFAHEVAEDILAIPIRSGMGDGVAWHYATKACSR